MKGTMERKLIGILLAMGLVFWAGCNGTSNPASPGSSELGDEEEIRDIMDEEMAEYFEEELLADDEDGGLLGKAADAIETDRWVRTVTSKELDVNIHFPGDGSAEVAAVAYLEGILRLVVEDSLVTMIYQKSFADTVKRSAVFRRNAARDPWPPYRRWFLESISIAEIVSTPVNTVEILSVSVENLTTGFTQSYSDPSALLDRETEIIEVSPGDEIELTVEGNGAGLLAFLHVRGGRIEMTDNGDGTYTGVYTIGNGFGARRAAVELLTEDTIFDDAADYDARGWALFYRVQ